MNLSTLIVLIIVAGLCALAIRYLMTHRGCVGCPDAKGCHGHCNTIDRCDPDCKMKEQKIDEIINKHGIKKVE